MGMYDEYEPSPPIACPICATPATYQGKDGPNALLLWRQGEKHPVDQPIDADARINPVRYQEFRLPDAFEISGFCERGHMFSVVCRCQDGTWTSAELSRPRLE